MRVEASPRIVPEELLRSVVGYFRPERVILFGSAARGTADPDSDLDLCVILDDDAPPEHFGWRAINAARRGYTGAVDILPLRRSAFDARRRIVGTLAWTVDQEGTLVYDRRPA